MKDTTGALATQEKFILHLDSSLRENSPNAHADFPFRVGQEAISNYENNTFPCHWHSEVEFTYVQSGCMEYQAGDTVYRIAEGNGIFVNAQVLHTARLIETDDCIYQAFVVDPVLLFGTENSSIYEKYVSPILHEPELFSTYLSGATSFGASMISHLRSMAQLYFTDEPGSELRIKSLLCEMWFLLYKELSQTLNKKETGTTSDIRRLKEAIEYIQKHYADPLSLADIASSCNVSKSECCHLFKRTLRRSPFDYLQEFRIQKSLPDLTRGVMSITELSQLHGFHSSSYYAESFKKIMGCSPREYKKRQVE